MATLLHIDSSPMGEDSISRRLTNEFVEQWRCAHPEGKVVSRDLTAIAIPVIDAKWIAANLTPKESRTREQDAILALSTEFTTELLDADEYAIGVPMHNWGPSSSFKLWTDHIVRFGETITVTEEGPRGTLGDKSATFLLSAGRRYDSRSPDASRNYLEPWLRTLFGNLGVRNMRFIFADGTVAVKYGKADRAEFLAPHIATVRSLFGDARENAENRLVRGAGVLQQSGAGQGWKRGDPL